MKKLVLSFVMIAAMCFAVAQPKIEFEKKTHEFGDIHEEGGKVTARFTFKNVGDSALVLTKVKPGCGCTAANYTREAIQPGQTGYVDATYDPWGRPGQFNKNIKVSTNISGETSPTIIFIKGNVIKRPPTKYELAGYKSGKGDFRVKEPNLKFSILNTEDHYDTLVVKNFYDDGRAVEVTTELPAYIQEASRSFGKSLAAGQEGTIVLKYNGAQRNGWGTLKDRAVLVTTDTMESRKYIYYTTTIREDFSKLTAKDLEKAPKAAFDHDVFQFDTIAQNTSASDVVKVTNNGKTPLVIRKIEASMPALTYKISAMTIEPGQSADLTLTYKAQSRRGRQSCSLEIITNSPLNAEKVIRVEGFIKQ